MISELVAFYMFRKLLATSRYLTNMLATLDRGTSLSYLQHDDWKALGDWTLLCRTLTLAPGSPPSHLT